MTGIAWYLGKERNLPPQGCFYSSLIPTDVCSRVFPISLAELDGILRPMFVCAAAVAASYRDGCWAYVEISFHLCSHLQQIVCKGAARSAETGSRRVQRTPLPSRALFVAEVHHLRQRQPNLPAAPAGLLWQLMTCFSLSPNAAHKHTKSWCFLFEKATF